MLSGGCWCGWRGLEEEDAVGWVGDVEGLLRCGNWRGIGEPVQIGCVVVPAHASSKASLRACTCKGVCACVCVCVCMCVCV